MFKNNFQGGSVVEIFSAQGKDPVAKWRLQGAPASINKFFDKEVKGFVYCVEGCSQTVKMQIPEDGKTTLGLLQRFLVLQVNVAECQHFSIELIIRDSTHLKKRLYLSTVHKEFSATPLHARIPFVSLKQNIWSNLCIDLVSFTEELFKTATFQTLDGIAVCANCKLRRIFTMKAEPADSSDGGDLFGESGLRDVIPASCRFPRGVRHVTQMFSMEAARQTAAAAKLVNSDSTGVHQSPAAAAGSAAHRKPPTSSHLAFGSRVTGPPPHRARKSGRSQEETQARVNAGSDLSLRASEGQTAAALSVRSADGTPRAGGGGAFEVIAEFGFKVGKDQLYHSLHHQMVAAPSTRPFALPTPDPAQTSIRKPWPSSHGTDPTRRMLPPVADRDVAVTIEKVVTRDTVVTIETVVTRDMVVTIETLISMRMVVTIETAVTRDTVVTIDKVVTMESAVTREAVVTMETAVTRDTVETMETAVTIETAVTMETAVTRDTAVTRASSGPRVTAGPRSTRGAPRCSAGDLFVKFSPETLCDTSASQIHRCAVSISISSDDASSFSAFPCPE
ncbi:hypothetical protein NHX12_030838, partial [Muraenolepis orangiensis]